MRVFEICIFMFSKTCMPGNVKIKLLLKMINHPKSIYQIEQYEYVSESLISGYASQIT